MGRTTCSICEAGMGPSSYPGEICRECDARAVNAAGAQPATQSNYDTGDNPVFVDGIQCWRRYRFGGWVAMRDDRGCETVEEFMGIHDRRGSGVLLVKAGCAALDARAKAIQSGFRVRAPTKKSKFEGAGFRFRDQGWVACRTELVEANAQLLDATVAYMHAENAERALAILHPPPGSRARSGVDTDYLNRFRSAAWQGLRVAWITSDQLREGWEIGDFVFANHSAFLDELVARIRRALGSERIPARAYLRSRDCAEPFVWRVLAGLLPGYVGHQWFEYRTFYRQARCDGLWEGGGRAPVRIALEVKANEDTSAPFTQLIDNLGHADAAIQIRFVSKATRKALDAVRQRHPKLDELRRTVQEKLPVRLIEWPNP